MAKFFRRLTKRFFIIVNFIVVIIFLVACLTAYLTPAVYWYIALLGVGFIFIIILLLGFVIFWLLFRSRWVLLPLATLAIGWFQVHAVFAFHPFSSFDPKKEPGTLRLITWNVSRFDEMNKQKKGGKSYRLKMFQFIKEQNADVLCVQEFFESLRPDLFDVNVPYITKELNFPYHYVAIDHITWNNVYEHGVAIFSKYPIVDSFRLRYPGPESLKASESLIRATIDMNGKKINIFTSHLQSFLFTGNDYQGIRAIKRADDKDSVVKASKTILGKFRKSYTMRSQQANIVRRILDSSAYPEIMCGDFNDVPNSYTYFTVKGDRQDAFVKKSFGLGRTFVFISPTLRIDYIFADPQFDILQYKKTKLPYSDHFPLMADFRLKTETEIKAIK